MNKLGILLLVLSSLSSAVCAQEATHPDAKKVALAHETIAAMQADKAFDSMGAQMKQMALQMLGLSLANATPEQKAQAEKVQNRILDLSLETAKGLLGKMDALYADVYSEVELQAMKTFFSSPEGKSMLSKQPELMKRFGPYVQQMQREIIPKIQAIVAEEKAAAEKAAGAATSAPGPALAPSPTSGPGPVPLPSSAPAPGPASAPAPAKP
jgi:hypothetical protein